jgi:hypothetical protein
MPVWGALVGTLVFNYSRHRGGRSTLCSVTRSRLRVHRTPGRLAVVLGWSALTGWLIPHILMSAQLGHQPGRSARDGAVR